MYLSLLPFFPLTAINIFMVIISVVSSFNYSTLKIVNFF